MMRRSLSPTTLSALIMIVLALAFGYGSYRLGFWDYGMPGSGLLPMLASVALLLLSGILISQARKQADEEPFRLLPIMALALVWVYALALPWLGFAIPTVIMLFIWVKYIYQRPAWVAGLVAVLLTLGGIVLFGTFLDTPIEVWPHV